MDFYQDGPNLENSYSQDRILQVWLKRYVPDHVLGVVGPHLQHVGELAVGPWLLWSQQAEAEEPEHVPFSPWGQRIDDLRISDGWRRLERAAVQEGIVASAYERRFGEYSRVYNACLLYLFHASSAFVSCPLAMTDGAARALELYGDESLKKTAFRRLISRDPEESWTSVQWMTERTGGSDVSGTSTLARPLTGTAGWEWQLYGVKWFTSALTAPMALLLARPEGSDEGSRGLSLFYTELRDDQQRLKQIEVLRLKNKLGTRALPTAELALRGTPAKLVGGIGNGVKKISTLFNITRVYNSVCATAHLRRALDLAQSYSSKRRAFGKYLKDQPLHASQLKDLEERFAKCFSLTFYVAHLLGRQECGTANSEELQLLRALTPVVKAYTARECMAGVSEVIEVFGGAGYIEDTGIPKLLRDAQVFSIWEGTTNILALDLLRAIEKEEVVPALNAKVMRDFVHGTDLKVAERWQIVLRLIGKEETARQGLLELGDFFGEQLLVLVRGDRSSNP
jgi:putative acyl-CoA dehydrogenase